MASHSMLHCHIVSKQVSGDALWIAIKKWFEVKRQN